MQQQSSIPVGVAASQAIKGIQAAQTKLKGTKAIMETKTLAAHWINTKVTISETIEGERKALGIIDVPVPTLAAFGIQAAFKLNDKQEVETDDDGIPLYAEATHNYLMDSVIKNVQARARNQLVPKTVELKDGKTIACNFDELFAASERDGTHLKNRAEAVKAFKGFLMSVGVKEQLAETMAFWFRTQEALRSQTETVKQKMKARIEGFTNSLDADALAKYGRTITLADEACAGEAIDPNAM